MKMKRIIAFAAAAAMAWTVCAFPGAGCIDASAAQDFVTEERYDSDDGTLNVLVDYRGKGGDITIPSDIDWIDESAFEDNTRIRSVTFPVTDNFPTDSAYVDESAFEGCTSLKKVTFEGNTCIGEDAFYFCINLESVNFKGGITDCIDDGAFSSCERLKTVNIAKGSSKFYIGETAFANCYKLSKITIPDNCSSIKTLAFLNCHELQSVTVPAKTKIDGGLVFGTSSVFKSKSAAEANIEDEDRDDDDDDVEIFTADGRKSGYNISYSTMDSNEYEWYYKGRSLYVGVKKVTPKPITLSVAKGSSAEKWAKENGIKYGYTAASSAAKSDSKLAAPGNIKASAGKEEIVLTWDKVNGADAYRVYILNSEGKYEKYKDIKGTKCTVTDLESGTKYTFKVVALVKDGGKYQPQTSSKAASASTKK